ncbi:LEA type 2 family protein [Methanoculleus sp.]|uniref:LEA type 2 family protein n=1 Tax=Methanoculleus sp. TaxID=90427 RepID=UPI002FCB0CDD
MRPLAIIIFVAVLLCSAGCVAPLLQEPTVTVENVTVENITLQSVDLSLQVTIENPNPIGATLNRVAFDVFFLDDGQWVFLAHGERGGFSVRPRGTTTVSIPVTVDNLRLVQALLRGLSDGTITLRVSGSGVLDYGVATFEIPFDRTTEV